MSDSQQIDVSILVISYNTRELLAECLKSIEASNHALSCETIVVDNASTDGSADMAAREFPGARLIRNSANRGFAAANNQALAESRGRYVLLLNSDAVLLPTTVRALSEYLDAHPRVGIVGGRVLNQDGSFQWSYADLPSLRSELLLATGLAARVWSRHFPSHPPQRSQQVRDVGWLLGACLMLRRNAIVEVGVLDEGFFMYSEETDWCCRMHKAGWVVRYLPVSTVLHHSGGSASKEPGLQRTQVYASKWRYLRKHEGRTPAAIYRWSLFGLSLAKLVFWSLAILLPGEGQRARVARLPSYRHLLGALAGGYRW
jgi:N-acetylglucosaminyl-diphospho-decaprenol L-rhamnosyltransferase